MKKFLSKNNAEGTYLFKVGNRNTRKMLKNVQKLTIKTPERCLLFLLLTWNIFHTFP